MCALCALFSATCFDTLCVPLLSAGAAVSTGEQQKRRPPPPAACPYSQTGSCARPPALLPLSIRRSIAAHCKRALARARASVQLTGAQLEVAHAALDLLVLGVVEVAVHDLCVAAATAGGSGSGSSAF